MEVRTDWGTEYAARAGTVPALTKDVRPWTGSDGRGRLRGREL